MLPPKKEGEALANAVERLAQAGSQTRNLHLCEWLVTRAFLAGVRNFKKVEFDKGEVELSYENQYNDLTFRDDEALRDYQIELGRFLGIDVRPSVGMLGWGLDRLRASSVGQVVLDYQVDDPLLSKIRVPFMEQLLQLGPSVLQAGVREAGALSGRSTLSVVAPWEILPIPNDAQSPQQAVGMMRTRLVPLEWLKKQPLWDKLKRMDQSKLRASEVSWEDMAAATSSQSVDASAGVAGLMVDAFGRAFRETMGASPSEKVGKYREGRLVVRLVEYWLKTPEGLVRRYGVKIGDVIAEDWDYEKDEQEVWFPIGLARYYGVGFYGSGYVAPLRSFVLETEKNLKAVWRALREADSMGIVTIPTDLGIDDDSFRLDESPRKVYYEPDPLEPTRGIGQIAPKNIGTLPTQGIQVGAAFISKLAGQSPMYSGKSIGRVDSSAGMGLALETNNVGIEAPGNSIADAFSTVYAAILASAKYGWTQQVLLQALSLETNIVGVAMAADGTVNLDKNPIPTPREVKINIKSRTPPSPNQQLQELRTERQLGHITPLQYRIAVYRKGLPTDVANEAEFQSWRKIRYMIRMLFNDGETPQAESIAPDQMSDNVEVCESELAAFMASPEFSLASAEVKDAFVELREQYELMKGKLPEGLPYPEQIAAGRPAARGPIRPQMANMRMGA
jgi:hypothetical protein